MESTIKIKAFGQLAELIGSDALSIPAFETSNEVLNYLSNTYPELKNTRFSLAINHQLVNENTTLPQEAEIALLPLFSGG